MRSAADFIHEAQGVDTLIMMTLVNVYQRLLLIPDGKTKERLTISGTYGEIRNEIALLSGISQKDTEEAFEAMAKNG